MSGLDPWKVYSEDLHLPGTAMAFLRSAQAHLALGRARAGRTPAEKILHDRCHQRKH